MSRVIPRPRENAIHAISGNEPICHGGASVLRCVCTSVAFGAPAHPSLGMHARQLRCILYWSRSCGTHTRYELSTCVCPGGTYALYEQGLTLYTSRVPVRVTNNNPYYIYTMRALIKTSEFITYISSDHVSHNWVFGLGGTTRRLKRSGTPSPRHRAQPVREFEPLRFSFTTADRHRFPRKHKQCKEK